MPSPNILVGAVRLPVVQPGARSPRETLPVPILVTCACGKQFQTKDENAGLKARCPECGRELIVPKSENPYAAAELAGDLRPGFQPPQQPATSGKAIASLVLGLVSFACSILTGIPAIILGILGLQDIKLSRGALTGRGMATAGIVLGALSCTIIPIMVLVALLLPAVQAAREAARRAQCVNNLKQIGLAMHNYQSTYGVFPPAAAVGPDGKPLLSWRVLILPYIEQDGLYQQFKLDEPWDSPNNKPLLERMPRSFTCPSFPGSETAPTTSIYQVLIGPGTLFDKAEGVSPSDIRDGTSNTLMVVESKAPVAWSQPSGLAYRPGTPIEGLGSVHPGGFNALFGDGSVRFLKTSVPSETINALATRNGGEVVAADAY
jgi:prepilin-type processing-associated H-X9-DG protein